MKSARHAVTRIDVMVVCVLVVLTSGVVIPVVAAMRETADLKASQNNLRQIGQAVLLHEKTLGQFPYGTYHDNASPGNTADPKYHMFYGGFVAILPYLDEEKLYRSYDPSLSPVDETDLDGDGWSNRKVTATRPKVYLSPAMPAPENPPDPGWGSYAWSGGNNDFESLNGGNLTGGSGGWHDGPIVNAKQGPIRTANITDGVAYTILAGDAHFTLQGLNQPNQDKKQAAKPVTGNTIWGRGHYPRAYLSTNTAMNTHASKHSNPNSPDWYMQGAFGFRSVHPGGCNFVFCDASVRFVKDSIPLAVYKALGSRAGGELLNADDY